MAIVVTTGNHSHNSLIKSVRRSGDTLTSLEPLSSLSPARKIEKNPAMIAGIFMAIFGGSTPCPRKSLEIVASESPRNVLFFFAVDQKALVLWAFPRRGGTSTPELGGYGLSVRSLNHLDLWNRIATTETYCVLATIPLQKMACLLDSLGGQNWGLNYLCFCLSYLCWVELPFESKLLPAVLLLLRIYFPQITVTVTVLKFRRISITVTVLASAVTPSFPLIPNYRLESHLN